MYWPEVKCRKWFVYSISEGRKRKIKWQNGYELWIFFFCFSWMMNRKNIMIQFLMLICFFCLSLSFSAKKSFFYYLFYKKWFQRNHRICLLFNSIRIWFYVKIVYINLSSSCHAVWNDLTYIIIEQQVHTSSMSYMIIILLSLSHSLSLCFLLIEANKREHVTAREAAVSFLNFKSSTSCWIACSFYDTNKVAKKRTDNHVIYDIFKVMWCICCLKLWFPLMEPGFVYLVFLQFSTTMDYSFQFHLWTEWRTGATTIR